MADLIDLYRAFHAEHKRSRDVFLRSPDEYGSDDPMLGVVGGFINDGGLGLGAVTEVFGRDLSDILPPGVDVHSLDADTILSHTKERDVLEGTEQLIARHDDIKRELDERLARDPFPLVLQVSGSTARENHVRLQYGGELGYEDRVLLTYAITGKVPTGYLITNMLHEETGKNQAIPYDKFMARVFGGEPLRMHPDGPGGRVFEFERFVHSLVDDDRFKNAEESATMVEAGIRHVNGANEMVSNADHVPIGVHEGQVYFALVTHRGIGDDPNDTFLAMSDPGKVRTMDQNFLYSFSGPNHYNYAPFTRDVPSPILGGFVAAELYPLHEGGRINLEIKRE